MVLGRLAGIGGSAYWWLALLLFGLSSEFLALFFQYVREELPCVLCIQVRLLMAALVLVALAMLMLRRRRPALIAGHALVTALAAVLLERAWMLLGTERGFVVSSCGFDLGLPSWFTPDRWLPALFEVQTTCGYTPELLFGITMAEVLIVLSPLLLLTALALTVAVSLRPRAVA